MQEVQLQTLTCWFCNGNAAVENAAYVVQLTKAGETDKIVEIPRCKTCKCKHSEGIGLGFGIIIGLILLVVLWWFVSFMTGLIVAILCIAAGVITEKILSFTLTKGEQKGLTIKRAELATAYPEIERHIQDGWQAPHLEEEQSAVLFEAVKEQDVRLVTEMLDANPRLINTAKKSKRTLLQYAVSGDVYMTPHFAQKDPTVMARLLIDRGAEVIVQCTEPHWRGRTLLHLACKDACLEVVKYLLCGPLGGAGVRLNVNGRDENGQTPLHLAVDFWPIYAYDLKVPLIEFLLANGAQINTQDNEGFTPLMRVIPSVGVTNASWEAVVFPVVKTLLAYGADPILRNRNGQTAGDILMTHKDEDKEDQGFRMVVQLFRQWRRR